MSTDVRCSCSILQNTVVAFEILQFVPGAGESCRASCSRFRFSDSSRQVFSALRAYVLSRSKLLGVFILALSLAPVGANLVSEWKLFE